MRRLVDRQQAVPVGGRVAAVDGPRPIEVRAAARDEIPMEVRDIAVGVGKDRVVRRVGVQLHALLERLVITRLRACIRLRECFDGVLHHADAHPLPVCLTDDRTMMRAIDGELFRGHPGQRSVRYFDGADPNRALLVAVFIEHLITLLHDRLEIFIDRVDAA